MGAETVGRCGRVMIFGSTQTVKNYAGNEQVQVHGPGYSKILIGDDLVDQWEDYIDLMVDSIYKNSGRGMQSIICLWLLFRRRQHCRSLPALMPLEFP